ncbi:reverse transcriptase domain-containing protein [Tanacetum coccineum]|uniref:Reverse transcriptase domain-containing protein n=1 Tax=Tanacetum coccineum TaxID=301880 RepID=A0ABQ5AMC1_9ASTR
MKFLNVLSTSDDLVSKFINKFFPPSKTTNLRNEITRFQQRFDETFYEAWDRFNDLLRACPHHGFLELHQLDTFYNALNSNDQDSLNSAAGGNFLDKMPRDCLRIIDSKSKVRNSRNKPVVAKVSSSSSTPGISPDVAELKDMVKALLLDKKNQNQAPAPVKAVEESCVTCGGAHSYRNCPATDGNVYRHNIQEYVSQAAAANFNQGNTDYRAPIANQIRPPGSGTLPSNTITNPKVDLKGITTRSGVAYQGPTIPTTSSSPPKVVERETEVTKDMVPPTNNGNLSFEISLADALILMPKFASTLKSLIGNKEKLSKMARTPLNEHCSAVILNKLPEKLGDPGKFLIPCDFPGMDECLALADLGASINLMPLSVWKKLSLPELTPTCMTLELADRSITQPIGITEDVYLKTERALIDVYEGELTLRVGKEAVTFNLDQTLRYSSNYDDMTVNRIDVIEIACEEYSQEVLGFSDGDILLLESFLNDDPSLPPPTQGNYLPEIRKELKVCEAKTDKSSIDEPPEVELKDLPPHLEYTFFEGDDKLRVIIAKDLSVEKKAALIKVLKSHKRADKKWISTKRQKGGTFQRCMLAIFHDMVEKTMEVFIDNFLVFVNSFENCLSRLEKMLQRCEDTNLCLNWEKSHFMVKEGIVLGHKISKNGIEVDKAKVGVIAKLPYPTIVKGAKKLLTSSQLAIVDPPRDIKTVGDHRKVQLNELNEIRDHAYENSLIYKEKTKRIHDSKIKNRVFNVGDQVLLFNSRLKMFSGKLKSRWSRPFTISHVFPYGTVELSQNSGPNFKVNGHRIKHYFGGDVPQMVVPDLQTFPKDK